MSVAAGTVNKTQQVYLNDTECADHLANFRCFPGYYNVTLVLQIAHNTNTHSRVIKYAISCLVSVHNHCAMMYNNECIGTMSVQPLP